MADVPDAILPAGSAELEKKKQRAPEVVKGTAQPAPRSLADSESDMDATRACRSAA